MRSVMVDQRFQGDLGLLGIPRKVVMGCVTDEIDWWIEWKKIDGNRGVQIVVPQWENILRALQCMES